MQNLALERGIWTRRTAKRKDQTAELERAWGKKNQPFNR